MIIYMGWRLPNHNTNKPMRKSTLKSLNAAIVEVRNAEIITGGGTTSKTTASGSIDFESTSVTTTSGSTSNNG